MILALIVIYIIMSFINWYIDDIWLAIGFGLVTAFYLAMIIKAVIDLTCKYI